MKVNQQVKIVTDIDVFNNRVDEITSATSFDAVKHCASRLKRALYMHNDCAAVCAPQIGEDLRMFVVRTAKGQDERFKVFLNPMVISSEGLHMSREANISLPDKEYLIPRKDKVHVAYQSIDGQVGAETFIGAYGEVVQQMIEMLDGITLADYGLDLDDVGGADAFDNATKKNKAELIALYLETLKLISDDLAKEIDETPELKYMDEVIRFNTDVLSGKIEVMREKLPETETGG